MPYALVTGSAKGIGRAIAAELAAKGYNLLLVDIDGSGLEISKEKINAANNIIIHLLPLDLSLPEAVTILTEWCKPFYTELSIVVNNAGYGLNAPFEKLDIDEHINIIDVNIKAQMKISHAFIPLLKKFSRSYLLNVGSTTCFQPVPYLAVYAASKAFVLSFTRSLRYELKDSPISVSCLIPGSTDTDFVNRARMGEYVRKKANAYNMTAEAVAKIAVNGMFKGKPEIIPGFSNHLHAFFPRFVPKSFVEKIAANIYKPR